MNDLEAYDSTVRVEVPPLKASMLSLPDVARTFAAHRYLGPRLSPWMRAEPSAMLSPLVGGLAAGVTRSYQGASPAEYLRAVVRMSRNDMVIFSKYKSRFPLGIFAAWKIEGETQRMLLDGRPANAHFHTPPCEFTAGEDLVRIIVPEGYILLVARADLADYFHTAETDPAVRPHFGLRPVPAQALRDLGVEVPPDAVDELGYTHPYCATIPMGWNAAPALAQGAHEAVLYGAQGEGSAVARSLDAVLDPAARFSSERVPALDSEHALRSHRRSR